MPAQAKSSSRYRELLLSLVKKLLRQYPSVTREEFDRAFKSARGTAGGLARAEKRSDAQEQALAAGTGESFEEVIEAVQDALQATFGASAWSVATYPDAVIYYLGNPVPGMGGRPEEPSYGADDDEHIDTWDNAYEEATEDEPDGDNDADDATEFFKVDFTRSSSGDISFGARTEVEKNITYDTETAGDAATAYEQLIDAVEDALGDSYGDRVNQIATYSDHVIFSLDDDDYWEQEYETGDDGVQLGDKHAVSMSVSWEPVSAEDADAGVQLVFAKAGASGSVAGGKVKLPKNVEALPAAKQKQWIDIYNKTYKNCGSGPKCEKVAFTFANGVIKREKAKGTTVKAEWGDDSVPVGYDGSVELAASFSDKPWSGKASNYKDTDAYCAACMIDDNAPSQAKIQDKCKLPYKEPGGAVNKAALRSIASVLAGGMGGVKGVSPKSLAAAKKKHAALMKQAGIGGDTKAEDTLALFDGTMNRDLPQRLKATDWSQLGFAPVALRLGADDKQLPTWQQLHKIGSWVLPHASGQKIQMSRAMGNKIIENFQRGVVRRGVPLDERHFTDAGGHALGWLEEMKWGSEGQGLPGAPDPDGRGPILYGRFNYNALGQQKLGDSQYRHISPQYHFNYCDSETGTCYGPTMLAVGATNNPFLRVRDLQGNAAPEPVAVLEDGLITIGELDMVDQVKLEELEARLAASEAALANEKRQRHIATVDAYLREEMHKGLPPALARLAKPILLSSSPDSEAVVSLSDDSAEPTHNLHEAVKALLSEIPHMPLGVQTQDENVRPFDPNKQPTLDDQLIPDYVKSLLENARLNGPGIDGVLASTARSDG